MARDQEISPGNPGLNEVQTPFYEESKGELLGSMKERHPIAYNEDKFLCAV